MTEFNFICYKFSMPFVYSYKYMHLNVQMFVFEHFSGNLSDHSVANNLLLLVCGRVRICLAFRGIFVCHHKCQAFSHSVCSTALCDNNNLNGRFSAPSSFFPLQYSFRFHISAFEIFTFRLLCSTASWLVFYALAFGPIISLLLLSLGIAFAVVLCEKLLSVLEMRYFDFGLICCYVAFATPSSPVQGKCAHVYPSKMR